jgi:hypothetical protein
MLEIEEQVEAFEGWRKYAFASEKTLINYLGSYYSPYLKYISCRSQTSRFDSSTNLGQQERRMFWVIDTATSMSRETEIMIPATWFVLYFKIGMEYYIGMQKDCQKSWTFVISFTLKAHGKVYWPDVNLDSFAKLLFVFREHFDFIEHVGHLNN